MSSLSRLVLCWSCSAAVVASVVPLRAAAAEVPATSLDADIDRAFTLQDQAQAAFAAAEGRKDADPSGAADGYIQAAKSWREAVELLPESIEFRRDRSSFLLQMVAACERAVALRTADPGPLRDARDLIEQYQQSLVAAYGNGARALEEWKATASELARIDGMLAGYPSPREPAPKQREPVPFPRGRVAGLGISTALTLGSLGVVIAFNERMKSLHERGEAAEANGAQAEYESLAAKQETARSTALAFSVIGGAALIGTTVFAVLTARALRKRQPVQALAAPVRGGLFLGATFRF